MACREVLLTLYRKGLINYPPGVHDGNNKKRNQSIPFVPTDKTPLNAKLSKLEPVQLKLVRNTELEALYNSLVQEHHYLRFRQIVGNLLKNALHHRRQKLEIKMDIEDDVVSLTVSDDGPGVEPDHHEMIFKRYAQVKECSIVPRKGHGLGLAGALILARCLGGDIKIVSEKGQGAAFCLTLPVSMENV